MRRTKAFSLLLVIILLSGGLRDTSTAAGAPPNEPPIRLVPADLIPPAMTTLAVEGDYAYVGTSRYLVVIDVSDPDNPKQVAYAPLPAPARQVAAAWGRAYVLTDQKPFDRYAVTNDDYIYIFDVRNPREPRLMGQFGPGNFFSLAAQGFMLYLSSFESFSILDVSDPSHPIPLASLNSLPQNYAPDVSVSGNQAILASSIGLWVIDISDPFHPAIIGDIQDSDGLVSGGLVDLSVEGDLAALAGGDLGSARTSSGSECILIDLSDPAHPAKIGLVGSSYGSYPSVVLLNQRVYFSGHDEPFAVYDATDPGSPVQIGQGKEPVWGLASADGLVYVAAGEMGMAIYDGHGQDIPLKRGALLGISTAEDVAVQWDNLYIADGGVSGLVNDAVDYVSGGFAVGANHPPEYAEIQGRLVEGGHGAYVDVQGNQAYFTAGSCFLRYTSCHQALFIVDVTQSEAPSDLGSFDLGHDRDEPFAGPVSIQNQTAYVLNQSVYQNGLVIVDKSQPITPTLLSIYRPLVSPPGSSGVYGAAITGTYGLITDWTWVDSTSHNSLQVIDVSNPLSPTLLTDYPMKYPNRVFVQNSTGFVAVRADNAQSTLNTLLRVLDLTGLPQVRVLADINLPGEIYDVAYDGRYAYVADGQAGLRVIDLSDPSNPLEVFAFDSPGNAVAVAQDGEWVYLADQDGGLLVFRKVMNFVYMPVVNVSGAP